MLNHRLINPPRSPAEFVKAAVIFLQKYAVGKKVFCALSGGIDSAATYLLLKKANINTIPVFIDHGLMRIIRGQEERDVIKNYFPDVRIIDIRDTFLPLIIGESDAEKKRQLFKKGYSETISKVIIQEKCDLLADGTILPDIEESFGCKITDIKETMTLEEEQALLEKNKKGFVKSQHNLSIEYKVQATIQPVASCTKDEVRKLLEYFKMPSEMIYRKAFPGPALAARIIGAVTMENLNFEKRVHDIVESTVDDYYLAKHGRSMIINAQGDQEPFQVFAAISEKLLETKVTGLKDGKRTYQLPLCEKGSWDFTELVKKAQELKGYGRLFYEMGSRPSGKFDVVLRCINSKDARTARVTQLPSEVLEQLKLKLLAVPKVKNVYFDVTPKPPATIEYV